jgi:hypothetical protein
MGIETTIIRDRKVVVTLFLGKVSGEEILAYQEKVWGDPALAGFDLLLDFSAAIRTNVSAEAIRALAERSQAIDGTVPCRTAMLVADDPVAVTGANLYKAALETFPNCGRRVQVFSRQGEAEAWLGLPAAALHRPRHS